MDCRKLNQAVIQQIQTYPMQRYFLNNLRSTTPIVATKTITAITVIVLIIIFIVAIIVVL